MRPWHRDALAVSGMLLIAGACFLVDIVLGLFVLGVQLVIAALLLSLLYTTEDIEEPDDGA